jgi:hypothetical protein
MAADAAAADEIRKIVIKDFVRALGGGGGAYIGTESSKTFKQDDAHSFGNRDNNTASELGLGFGRIKFLNNDQSAPYIRIPWNISDDHNKLRAQVSTHPSMFQHYALTSLVNFVTDCGSLCRACLEPQAT